MFARAAAAKSAWSHSTKKGLEKCHKANFFTEPLTRGAIHKHARQRLLCTSLITMPVWKNKRSASSLYHEMKCYLRQTFKKIMQTIRNRSLEPRLLAKWLRCATCVEPGVTEKKHRRLLFLVCSFWRKNTRQQQSEQLVLIFLLAPVAQRDLKPLGFLASDAIRSAFLQIGASKLESKWGQEVADFNEVGTVSRYLLKFCH